jgi:hypothetical protein
MRRPKRLPREGSGLAQSGVPALYSGSSWTQYAIRRIAVAWELGADQELWTVSHARATNIAAMRRTPVMRSEVRFDGKEITTLPADAVTEDSLGWLVPIQKLFAPLLRSLDRSTSYEYEQAIQSRKDVPSQAGVGMKPWEPIRCPWPYDRHGGPHACRRCGRGFYRSIAGRYLPTAFCSDACAEATREEVRAFHNAATKKARSEATAAARAGRRCAYCDKPLTAQRSTKKYCDAHCRFQADHSGTRYAARRKALSEAAAAARAGRRCAYCNKPIKALHSTKKFCDAHCRGKAWYRARRRCPKAADP